MRLESLRVFLAGACIGDDDLLEVDVVNPNFKACRLLRPLEGTKQAGNLWMVGNNKTINKGLGFEQCAFEPNVWRKVTSDGIIYLAVYVDNVVLRYPLAARPT